MRHLLTAFVMISLAFGMQSFAAAPPMKGLKALPETPSTEPVKRQVATDLEGNIKYIQLTNLQKDKMIGPESSHPVPTLQEGELAYVAMSWHKSDTMVSHYLILSNRDPEIIVMGAENFKTPAPGSGTVNPKAKVVLVKAGGQDIAVALDALTPDAQYYEVLRVDFSGKGQFKDAGLVPWDYLFDNREEGKYQYDFSRNPIYIQIGARSYVIGLSCRYVEGAGEHRLALSVTTHAEGTCRFGDNVYKVRLHDTSGNLRVDDPLRAVVRKEGDSSKFETWGDTFEVVMSKGKNTQWITGCYGHPIVVDGSLYNVVVSEDGGRIKAEPYTGPTGKILIEHPAWSVGLINEKILLCLSGGSNSVPVPEGEYVPIAYEEWWSKEAALKGNKSLCDPVCIGIAKPVRVVADQVTNVLIGSPLKGTLKVRQEGNALVFEVTHVDAQGAKLQSSYPDSKGNTKPSIVITDASGKTVDKVSSQRGGGYQWQIPAGLQGVFTASADYGANPKFPVQTEKLTFNVPLDAPSRVVAPRPAPAPQPVRPAPEPGPAPAAPRPAPVAVKPPAPALTASEERRLRAHSALQLATMLEKAGKVEAARQEYERILQAYPDTDEAAEARTRLQALKAAGDPAAP